MEIVFKNTIANKKINMLTIKLFALIKKGLVVNHQSTSRDVV